MTGHELSSQILDVINRPWPMLLLKVTAVLAAGWLGNRVLRDSRPRYRLFWWRGVVCALLLLGAVSLFGPRIRVPLLPANATSAAAPASVPVAASNTSGTTNRPAAGNQPSVHVVTANQPSLRRNSQPFERSNNTAKPPHKPSQPETIPAPDTAPANRKAGTADTTLVNSETANDAAPLVESAQTGVSTQSWIIGIWFAGVLLCFVRLLLASVRLKKFLRAAEPVSEQVDSVYQELKGKVGCRAPITVMRHDGVASPVLHGVRRPSILLPGWMCAEKYREDLPGVFAHELSHVRSFDLLWQTLIHTVSMLLWFHPLAWRLRRTHVLACELKSDYDSANFLGETGGYVRTLARVALAASDPSPDFGLAMARTSEIGRRLAFLKNAVFPAPLRRRLLVAVGFVGLLICTMLGSLQLAVAETEVVRDEQPATTAKPDKGASAKQPESKQAKAKQAKAKQTRRRLLVSVRDEAGKLIPQATVVVRIGNERKTHRFDAAGNLAVSLPQQLPTYVILTVKAPKYVRTQARWVNRAGRLHEPIPERIAFRMERGTEIGGKVTDESGKPISGASVRLSVRGRQPSAKDRTSQSVYDFVAKTNAKGSWRCDVAPSKLTSVAFELGHPDYVSATGLRSVSTNQWPKLRKFAHVSMMERGHLVEGIVRGPDGKPIVGAVLALGHSPFGGRHPKPKTDKNGAYRFENVKKGDTAVTVVAKGFAPELRRVDVSDELDSVDFRLKKGKTIRIRVVDENKKPIVGAHVVPDTWRGHRSLLGLYEGLIPNRTDKNGRLIWKSAPDDEILFDVYQSHYMRARDRAITPKNDEYVITLPPSLRISGRVIDAETKKPIPIFKVVHGLESENATGTHWTRYDTANGRNGKYAMELTAPYHRHLVRAEAKGYRPGVSRKIRSDEGSLTIDFELKKATGPRGAVISKDRKPVSGAKVFLYTPRNGAYVRNGAAVDRHRAIQTTTGKSGKFSFDPQTDPYAIFVVADAGYAIVPQKELEELPTIRVVPWATVKGKLIIGTEPARNQRVSLGFFNVTEQGTPRIHFDYNATTDSKGRFEFQWVPTHMKATVMRRVVLSRHGGSTSIGSSHGQQIVLTPGKTSTVTLGGTGRPIVGQLQLPKGEKRKVDWNSGFNYFREPRIQPIPGVPVPYRPSYSIRVKPDGSFRVEDVPPGVYEIVCRARERKNVNVRQINRGKLIGTLRHTFTIAPIPGGRTDKPRDLGVLKLDAR